VDNPFLALPDNAPLRVALSTGLAPLVEGLLMNAIEACPPDFAEILAEDFAAKMLSPKIVNLLQERPELLEQLYGVPVES
jgi:hypothetical protein